MRKAEEYRKDFYEFSGQASAITRQLAFAGIAVIWLFKTDASTGNITVPHDLVWPGILIVAALAADLLHYFVGTLIWGGYVYYLGRKRILEVERYPHWLALPVRVLFVIKIGLVTWAYILILLFLIRKLGLM